MKNAALLAAIYGLVLAIAALVGAGLLSLAGRETAKLLPAYYEAKGMRLPAHLPQADDDPCQRYEVIALGNAAHLASRSVWDRACIGPYRAEVMHGVWYDGFEERGFVPNVSSVPRYRVIDERSLNPEFDRELNMDADEARRRLQYKLADHLPETVAIAITFIGRRTAPYRTPSGSLYQTILVDAVLSGRVLGPVETCVDLPGHEADCAPAR